jgi:hypothetical protein
VDDGRKTQQESAQDAVVGRHAAVRDRVMDGPHDPLAGKNHAKQDVVAVQKRRKREALVEPVEMVHVLPEFLALLLLGEVQKTGALERALVAEEPRKIREEMVRRVLASRIKADFDLVHGVPMQIYIYFAKRSCKNATLTA